MSATETERRRDSTRDSDSSTDTSDSSDESMDNSDGTETTDTPEVSGAEFSEKLARVLGLQLPLQQGTFHLDRNTSNKLTMCKNHQLLVAAQDGEVATVNLLIRCGADVNHLNAYGQRAIDLVWENTDGDDQQIKNAYDCMFLLLENRSKFPESFDAEYVLTAENAPDQLISLVKERQYLKEWIVNNEVDKIRAFSAAHDIISYYNFENGLPLHTAAEFGTEEILTVFLQKSTHVPPGRRIVSEKNVNMLEQVDVKGNTPLLVAASVGKKENVEFLVQSGADVSIRNNEGKSAVDLAWNNQCYDVVLSLLVADSHYPEEFSVQHISGNCSYSTELTDFAEGRENLHEYIQSGQLEDVKHYINTVGNPSSRCYLNINGDSALFTAIKNPRKLNIAIFAYFKNKGLCFKKTEEEEFFHGLEDEQKDELRLAMIENFPEIPDAHISFLVSKSKPSVSCDTYTHFTATVEAIYRELDKIPEVSLMMKVIQYNDYVEVLFDFTREDTTHMDPCNKTTTKGNTYYRDGRIYIAFKTNNSEDKHSRLGTLAHELAHLAMQITYHNNCNPFGIKEKDKKEEFKKVIEALRKKVNSRELDNKEIKDVFLCYTDKSLWPSELIVRVPHILATYGKSKGERILKKQARSLHSYFKNRVMEDCEQIVEQNYLIKPRNLVRQLNQYLGMICDIEKANMIFENARLPHDFVGNACILLIRTCSTTLSCICAYQALQEIMQCSSQNNFIFLKLDQFERIQEDVRYTFRSKVCNTTVVECPGNFEKDAVKNVMRMLADVLSEHKKIIFIVSEGDDADLIHDAIREENLSSVCIEKHDINFGISDFTSETQVKILSTEVCFQGKKVILKNLVDTSQECIDSYILSKIISKESIYFGRELSNLGDTNHYYIPRSFVIPQVSSRLLINENTSDLFFVTGSGFFTSANLKDFVPAEYSKTAVEQFDNVCTNNKSSNVHWLRCEDGQLSWIKTQGSISEIIKHRENDGVEKYLAVNELIQDDHKRVVIISDVAGMGKSTVLTALALEIKKYCPYLWVIRIDLNNHVDKLKHLKNILDNPHENSDDTSHESIVTFFIEEFLTFETTTEKNLFEFSLKTNNKAVVLFDGFDEISPKYNGVVIYLLRELKHCGVHKLIVTTRPVMKEELEDNLNAFSFALKPFTADNKKEFLTRFWKNKFHFESKININEHLEKYASELLHKLSCTINDRSTAFTGIPLQMRMIAEIFPEPLQKNTSVKHIFSLDNLNVPENFDIIDLYDRFISKKYYIYTEEKVKIGTVSAEEMAEKYHDIFIDNHQQLAVLHLLHEEKWNLLLSDEQLQHVQTLILEIYDGKEKTGIIDKASKMGNTFLIHFIHRSFAEYFVARYLWYKMGKALTRELQELLLQYILYDDSVSGVRIFLNGYFDVKPLDKSIVQICGNTIHELFPHNIWAGETRATALQIAAQEDNGKIAKFIVSSLENHENTLKDVVNSQDVFGSSAIHWATSLNNSETVELLIVSGAEVNRRDCFGRTPLHMASIHGSQNAMKSLLDNSVDVNTEDNEGNSALHRAAIRGNINVIKLLVQHDVDVNAVNEHGMSALFAAAENHYRDIMELLIKTGARISINGLMALYSREGSNVNQEIAWLLQQPIRDSTTDDIVREVLRWAITMKYFSFVKFIVKLIKNKLPTVKNVVNHQTLLRCAEHSEWELVEDLRNLGVDESDNSVLRSKNLLHHAAFQGRLNVVKRLVQMHKNGDITIDFSEKDEKEFTALELSATFGRKELVEFLWQVTESAGTTKINAERVLILSASFGEVDLLKWILEDKHVNICATDETGRNSLHYAAARNTYDVVEYLLFQGAAVNQVDNTGRTPLHYASDSYGSYILSWVKERATYADLSSVIFMTYGCNKNVTVRIYDHYNDPIFNLLEVKGFRRMHFEYMIYEIVIPIKAKELVSLMIKWDANVNVADLKGITPIHLATSRHYLDVMQLLSEKGADLNHTNDMGQTPLHLATLASDRSAVKWLISQKVDFMRDARGYTPFRLSDDTEISKCLKETYKEEITLEKSTTENNLTEFIRKRNATHSRCRLLITF